MEKLLDRTASLPHPLMSLLSPLWCSITDKYVEIHIFSIYFTYACYFNDLAALLHFLFIQGCFHPIFTLLTTHRKQITTSQKDLRFLPYSGPV